jgi:hypothetical protein
MNPFDAAWAGWAARVPDHVLRPILGAIFNCQWPVFGNSANGLLQKIRRP